MRFGKNTVAVIALFMAGIGLVTFAQIPPPDGTTVNVVMQTELGEIVVELYPDKAPITTGNFLRYVDEDIYADRATFYRAVRIDNQSTEKKIEVIQGGLGMGPADAGKAKKKLPPIAHETTEQTGILHTNGTISMARLDPGTASSEFFICINDQPSLDFGGLRNPDGFGFAAFGKVIEGMDVVRSIQQWKTDKPVDNPASPVVGQIFSNPIKITSITRQQ